MTNISPEKLQTVQTSYKFDHSEWRNQLGKSIPYTASLSVAGKMFLNIRLESIIFSILRASVQHC